jgi:SAM-dependent methyltransferase
MHAEAWSWIAANRPPIAGRVLDMGSREAGTGRVREIFPDATEYVGIDYQEGPGVDIVADIADSSSPAPEWLPENHFDVVVCAEVLEHAAFPGRILSNALYGLRRGGILLLTAAGPDRPPHTCWPLAYIPRCAPDPDGGYPPNPGEFYQNIEPLALESDLWLHGFKHVLVEEELNHHDVYAYAVKP